MHTPYSLIYSTYNGDDAPQNCNSVLCKICNTFLPAFSSASFSEYFPYVQLMLVV